MPHAASKYSARQGQPIWAIREIADVQKVRVEPPAPHYGVITAKFLAVLDALLWGFHNCGTGRCFPSYEAIAERADCARSTVYEAINALERAGVLTWVNRIVRIREWGPDLFGRAQNRWRVIRTSNAYTFVDPKPVTSVDRFSSRFEIPTGTGGQEFNLEVPCVSKPQLDPANPLHQALKRLGAVLEEEKSRA